MSKCCMFPFDLICQHSITIDHTNDPLSLSVSISFGLQPCWIPLVLWQRTLAHLRFQRWLWWLLQKLSVAWITIGIISIIAIDICNGGSVSQSQIEDYWIPAVEVEVKIHFWQFDKISRQMASYRVPSPQGAVPLFVHGHLQVNESLANGYCPCASPQLLWMPRFLCFCCHIMQQHCKNYVKWINLSQCPAAISCGIETMMKPG